MNTDKEIINIQAFDFYLNGAEVVQVEQDCSYIRCKARLNKHYATIRRMFFEGIARFMVVTFMRAERQVYGIFMFSGLEYAVNEDEFILSIRAVHGSSINKRKLSDKQFNVQIHVSDKWFTISSAPNALTSNRTVTIHQD